MHVAIRETNQRAGDPAASPENRVRICAACARHCFMLERNFVGFGDAFDPSDNFGMVAAAVGNGGSFANTHIAMLRFVDAGIIRGMSNVHNQSDIGLGYFVNCNSSWLEML